MAGRRQGDNDSTKKRKLRVIHFNDVYTLENLPRVKTLIRHLTSDDVHVMVSIGGDFLAPYLLSSLDHGKGMVDVLNSLPTTHAILGNHECDVPHASLVERAGEFGGRWINSNFRALGIENMPEYDVVELKGGFRVGVIGLLCDNPQLYRPGAFAGIDDPLSCAETLLSSPELSRCDRVIAFTHLDLADDISLIQKCPSLTCVLGGHDHEVVKRKVGGVDLVKAGMDARVCAVVDICCKNETVNTRLVDVTVLPEDEATRALVDSHMVKVKTLDEMILTDVEEMSSLIGRVDSPLTSQGARQGECSMATFLCSVIKRELDCDVAILEAGSVRADKRYDNHFTFSDLKQELPFTNATGIAAIDGRTLSDIVAESRRNWGPYSLHVDCDCDYRNDRLLRADKSPLDPDRVYSVAVGLDLGFGSKVNETMIEYARRMPKRIPALQSAADAKSIVLAFFVQRFWRRLPTFDQLKSTDCDLVTFDDVYDAFTARLFTDDSEKEGDETTSGCRVKAEAAKQMVCHLISAYDGDNDGNISRDEYNIIFSKYSRRQNYSKCAVRRESAKDFYIRRKSDSV